MVDYGWGYDLFASDETGLESLGGNAPINAAFNPVNIISERGIYFVTIYICGVMKDTLLEQQIMVWFASLKPTDTVRLNIASSLTNLPLAPQLRLIAAIVRSEADINIQLDTIVTDSLAYYYLAADKVTVGDAGALFVPPYTDTRGDAKSVTWRVVHDFFSWLVDQASSKHILTEDEADKLKSGHHVILDKARF
jgi:hypothetical protein